MVAKLHRGHVTFESLERKTTINFIKSIAWTYCANFFTVFDEVSKK